MAHRQLPRVISFRHADSPGNQTQGEILEENKPIIDPAKNLMINWFVFIQLSLSVLKLAGHNSMEWQERRLAVERLPCSGCITVCECCSAAPPNFIASLRRGRPSEFSRAAACAFCYTYHHTGYALSWSVKKLQAVVLCTCVLVTCS